MTSAMKLLIVENHALLQDLLVQLCQEAFDGADIEALAPGNAAVNLCAKFEPDVLLIDIDPPGLIWLKSLGQIARVAKVVALSSSARGYMLHRCEQSGVHGFVDKLCDRSIAVVDAIRAVSLNRRCFSASWTEVRAALRRDPFSFPKVLSEREQELLSYIGGSFSDDEIAALIDLKASSVRNHRNNIMRKLGLHGRAELRRYTSKHGFAPLEATV
jgi:DNA-binding NarL/FixJ family response regulator